MDELDLVRIARPPMAPMSPEAHARARHQLEVAIAEEQNRRSRGLRRRTISTVAIAAVAVSLVVLGIGPSFGPTAVAPADAVEIARIGDSVEIRFVDLAADIADVNAAIQEAGISVTVQFLPVSPSLVGSLVASSDDQSGASRVHWQYLPPGRVGAPPAVRIDNSFPGRLELTVGRPGLEGERFVSAAVSAEMPGEALHCTGIVLRPARSAADAIDERGLVAVWIDDTTQHRHIGTLPQQFQDWYVLANSPLSSTEVIVWIAPDKPEDTRSQAMKDTLQAGC